MNDRTQHMVMIAAVAALLLGLARIYQTFQNKVPLNLEGHIVVEGSMTANLPAQ